MTDSQEQLRQALRDVGQELSKAMEQAADDVSKLVGDPPRFRPKRPPDSPVEMIRELARLRDEGLLTEEEFQAKKAELLSRV